MDVLLLLAPLFFLTALLYAGAGFGGGSTYLALLTLAGVSYGSVPKIALACNLLVVIGSTYRFFRSGDLSLRLVLPFVVTSVPLAYIGGRVPIGKTPFLILLGISLAVAGLRLLFLDEILKDLESSQHRLSTRGSLMVGAGIGFLSGLVGIGGGIFLSPILYVTRFGNARQIAAVSSFFILVNSMSGLVGQFQKFGLKGEGVDIGPWLWILGGAVILGGQIGNRLTLGWVSPRGLQRLTGGLVSFASVQIFIRLFS